MHPRLMTLLPMVDPAPSTTRVMRVALAAATLATLVGCGGKALAPSASDALRAELAVRTQERDEAVARAAELDAKLLSMATERNARIDPEVAEAMPALAAVGLDPIKHTGLPSSKLQPVAQVSPLDPAAAYADEVK